MFLSSDLPTAGYYVSVSLVQTFGISTTGTYSYYLTGQNVGSEASYYFTTTIVGVYYPS